MHFNISKEIFHAKHYEVSLVLTNRDFLKCCVIMTKTPEIPSIIFA